jgi:hypothetical protein
MIICKYPVFLALVGLALLMASVVLGFRNFGHLGRLVIEEPHRSLGVCEPATILPVSFVVRNDSARTIRVVGLAPC